MGETCGPIGERHGSSRGQTCTILNGSLTYCCLQLDTCIFS